MRNDGVLTRRAAIFSRNGGAVFAPELFLKVNITSAYIAPHIFMKVNAGMRSAGMAAFIAVYACRPAPHISKLEMKTIARADESS